MKKWTIAAVLSTTAVLVSIAATPATAVDPSSTWLPTIADSASLSSKPLLSGEVTDSTNAPFPAGTRVEVVAFPSAEVVAAMAVGDNVQATPVSKGFVGDDGSFVLRLSDPSSLARFASRAGSVDFEFRAVDNQLYAPFSFSRTLAQLATLKGAVSAAAQSAEADADASSSIHVTSLAPSRAVALIEQAQSGPIQKTDICGEIKLSDLGTKQVDVGATYTGGTGRTGLLTYSSGASSALGVGYSISGSAGSFSASGTLSRSSTSTVSFGSRTGSNVYATYFSYGKYGEYCYPVGSSYSSSAIYAYEVHASSYAGGSSVTASTAPSATYCVSLATGTSFSKSTTSAYTFASGASLSSSIGINLSSKTGYTSTTSLKYTNSSGSTKNLCGTSGLPAGTPSRIVLK